jgi:hypothetical protein
MGIDEGLNFDSISIFFDQTDMNFPEFKEQISKNTDICYLFGISDKIDPILNWLNGKKYRKLIILEDRIFLMGCLKSKAFEKILNHKSIEIQFFFETDNIDEKILSIAQKNPAEIFEIFSTHPDGEKFEFIGELINKSMLVCSGAKSDLMLGNYILENVISNFRKIHECFDVSKLKDAFKGKPCILVGAGPSLNDHLEEIKKLNDEVLIFAAGSAISILANANIKPHMQFAICPTPEEFTRLKFMESYEVPLIFGSRLNHNVLYSHAGPLGYVSTETGGLMEDWLEEKLEIRDLEVLKHLPKESQTIVSIAIAIAIHFGVGPIILLGVDLAYQNDLRYAKGVISNLDSSIERGFFSIGDKEIKENGNDTLLRWVAERDAIDKLALNFGKNLVYKGSDKGLHFENIETKNNWYESLQRTKNLRKEVYEKVLSSPLTVSNDRVNEIVQQYFNSLRRVKDLVWQLILTLESCEVSEVIKQQKSMLIQYDLEDEIAYKLSFQPALYIFRSESVKELDLHDHEIDQIPVQINIFKKLNALIDQYLLLC